MNSENRSASAAEPARTSEEIQQNDMQARDRAARIVAAEEQAKPSTAAREGGADAKGRRVTALFDAPETGRWRERWTEIQVGFVDEPRRAVKEADGLVAEVVTRLSDVFTNERTGLERQWDRGDEVTTEDLRVALQRYRSFFDRLLSV